MYVCILRIALKLESALVWMPFQSQQRSPKNRRYLDKGASSNPKDKQLLWVQVLKEKAHCNIQATHKTTICFSLLQHTTRLNMRRGRNIDHTTRLAEKKGQP